MVLTSTLHTLPVWSPKSAMYATAARSTCSTSDRNIPYSTVVCADINPTAPAIPRVVMMASCHLNERDRRSPPKTVSLSLQPRL